MDIQTDVLGKSLKNGLASHVLYQSCLSKVVAEVSAIPMVESLRSNPELLLLIVNIVFDTVSLSKNKTIDWKELVCDIYVELFKYTPDELTTLRQHIQFMEENDQIIKPPSILTKCLKSVFSFSNKKKLKKSAPL